MLTLLIERDSCLHHHTTVKEAALGENNNNKKAPILKTTNISNTCYLGRAKGVTGLQNSWAKSFQTEWEKATFSLHGRGMMEELVQSEVYSVLLAVPRQLAKSSW